MDSAEKHKLVLPFKLCLRQWMPPQSFLLSQGSQAPRGTCPPGGRASPPSAWPPPAPSRVPPGRLPGMCLHAGLPASLLLGHLLACREPRGRAEDTGGTFLRSRQGQPTSLVIAGDSGKDGDKNGGNIDGQPPPLPLLPPPRAWLHPARSFLSDQSLLLIYIYIYQGLLSFNI